VPSVAHDVGGGSLVSRCERVYAALDAAVARAGVADAEATRVPGFPYLRTNRFLASFREQPLDGTQARAWVDAMMELDRDGRLVEIENLPVADTRDLLVEARAAGFPELAPSALLQGCSDALRERDFADGAALTRLRAAAVVPDDYDTWKRVVGLYEFTRVPFAAGVGKWQDETRATFATPVAELPVVGRLERYTIEGPGVSRAAAKQMLAAARGANPLGIVNPADLEPLVAAYAPVFEVDTAADTDRVGRPTLDADGAPRVDAGRPAIFVRITQTRYGGATLTQLVYTVWFPARPLKGALDLLGGNLDAVIWRVTLADDGEPLVFDTIHGCGCYHLWFPTPRATLRPQAPSLDEIALVAQTLPRIGPEDRMVVRIASGTHYVERVIVEPRSDPSTAMPLPPASEDALRRLPMQTGGSRSLFGPDGIVAGSERGERWLFWPMGVREPGAMRQWGRHATAFSGRRHFDEARLVERYFELELR